MRRAHLFLAGGACRAATSPSAWSGRNGPPRTAVAPLYAALLVAARRVPPHKDAAPCNKMRCRRWVSRAESGLDKVRVGVYCRGRNPERRMSPLRSESSRMNTSTLHSAVLLAAVAGAALVASAQAQSFVNFEGKQVNPCRLSPDGSRLFAVNTPDNRLSVFDVSNPLNPVPIAEIPVALEPVSVNPVNNDEAWVVNELSDSVTVVSVSRH